MIASAEQGLRHVFVHDLEVQARLGVLDWERERPQRVRVSVDLAVRDDPHGDRIEAVVSYAEARDAARSILTSRHHDLVESAAEAIALACLADPRVAAARVRIEKLEVFDDCVVGVEIERRR